LIREVETGFAVWDTKPVDGNPDVLAPMTYAPRWCFSTVADLCAFLAKHLAKPEVKPFISDNPAFMGDDLIRAQRIIAARDADFLSRVCTGDPPPGAAYDTPPQQPTAVDGA
jgi:hypothetical protein